MHAQYIASAPRIENLEWTKVIGFKRDLLPERKSGLLCVSMSAESVVLEIT